MTQVDLASELGLSNRTINRWETAGDEPSGYALLGLLRLAGHPINHELPRDVHPPPSGRISRLESAVAGVEERIDHLETRVRSLSLEHEETRRLIRLSLAALGVEDDADPARARARAAGLMKALEGLQRSPGERTRASDARSRREPA